MKKQIVAVAAVAGLSVASLAGAADINLYGASAQFDFLNANAVKFVQQYCAVTVPAVVTGSGNVIQYKTTGLGNTIKNGIVTGTNCGTGFGKLAIPGSADTNLNLRYSGFGSGEGITTMTKTTSLDPEFTSGCNVAAGERRQAPAGAANNTMAATAVLADYVAATTCLPVNIGTSDVAWDQFDQTATNELLSADGATNTYPPFGPFTAPAAIDHKTVAVPFGFYVNPGVTAYHCINTAAKGAVPSTIVRTGGLCTPTGLTGITANTEQCATGSECETTATTIDNITRLQANILYAGQITNWNQLGKYFSSNPVKICMRKPGSGTHVAFDKTVMKAAGKAGWGADYNTFANNDLGNLLPYTNFGGSSTDMKNCIAGLDGFKQPDGVTAVPATGAIGYMDADTADTAGQFIQVKYNGVKPNRTNVRNGAYEFYTIGHMYAENTALATAVATYVKNPANVPASKVKYWAAAGEMVFSRGLDTSYPAKGSAPSAPQTP